MILKTKRKIHTKVKNKKTNKQGREKKGEVPEKMRDGLRENFDW